MKAKVVLLTLPVCLFDVCNVECKDAACLQRKNLMHCLYSVPFRHIASICKPPWVTLSVAEVVGCRKSIAVAESVAVH